MLAIQLKNLIKDVPDVVIDAEYVAPVKKTIIKKEDMR